MHPLSPQSPRSAGLKKPEAVQHSLQFVTERKRCLTRLSAQRQSQKRSTAFLLLRALGRETTGSGRRSLFFVLLLSCASATFDQPQYELGTGTLSYSTDTVTSRVKQQRRYQCQCPLKQPAACKVLRPALLHRDALVLRAILRANLNGTLTSLANHRTVLYLRSSYMPLAVMPVVTAVPVPVPRAPACPGLGAAVATGSASATVTHWPLSVAPGLAQAGSLSLTPVPLALAA